MREEYKVIKTPQVYKILVDKAEKKRDLESIFIVAPCILETLNLLYTNECTVIL
jgi:hypothetical protein